MASNPLFIIPYFFCIFPINFAMAALGLKKMGKFLWEGREKSLPSWLSQFSFAKLRQPTEFFWKMQRKTWYSILGVDAMPLSLKNLLLKKYCLSI